MNIPKFAECPKCKRSFDFDNKHLWNIEQILCICCHCKVIKKLEEKECRQTSCIWNKRLKDDFITSVDREIKIPKQNSIAGQETIKLPYSESSNLCCSCLKEFDKDLEYHFLNIKHSFQGKTYRIKRKMCDKCFQKLIDTLNINKEQEEDYEDMSTLRSAS